MRTMSPDLLHTPQLVLDRRVVTTKSWMAAPRNNSVSSKVSKGKPTSRVPNESFEPDLHRHIGLSVLQDVASMSLHFPVIFWCSIPRRRLPQTCVQTLPY
jgi:hypothetical protein